MLLKIKENRSDKWDGPTMLMKTNGLIFYATICMKIKGLSQRWTSKALSAECAQYRLAQNSAFTSFAASHYVLQKKGASDERQKSPFMDMIENKTDNLCLKSGSGKNAGGKNDGFSHYVIENK
jgi:hypothetical protein